MDITSKPGSVYVRPYTRMRFGSLEHVCQHWRSYPRQLSLFG